MKPIAFIDIESTGLNRETDRIIEISIVKQFSQHEREVRTRRFNPGISIPAESTAIHGITNEMVKDKPSFQSVAKSFHALLVDCAIGGYGCLSFDMPLLYNEFLRTGIQWDYMAHEIIDCGNLFKIQEKRDLTAAVNFYCKREHADAHGAEPDAIATADVFFGQMCMYPELNQMTLSELAIYSNYGKRILDLSGKFTYNENGQIIFNFGPNRNQLAANHPDFIDWMLSKDFPPDTRKVCNQILNELALNSYE